MDAVKQIDEYIENQIEWQKNNLKKFRKLIHESSSEIREEWKWSVPVFYLKNKMIAAISSFKDHTKFNFFEGYSLKDSNKLFNGGFDSKKHRSVNLNEGEKIDDKKLSELIREAISKLNG